MNDLLSIVVPIYNQEKNLKICLDSIASQSYKKIEVILVDDGSTDNSLSICNDYALKNGWEVIHIANAGVSNARNVGLDKAQGKYVLFIDSDDYISENYVESLYDIVRDGSCDIAYAQSVEVHNNKFISINEPSFIQNVFDVATDYSYENSFLLRHATRCIISMKLVDQVRFSKDLYVGEDALFISQLIVRSNNKVGYIKDAKYYYVVYETSAIHGKIDEKKMTVIDAWNQIISNYKNTIPSLIPGCYFSLVAEIEGIIIKMAKSGRINKGYYNRCVKDIRANHSGLIKSSGSLKRLIRYIWMIYFPKSYYKFVVGIRI